MSSGALGVRLLGYPEAAAKDVHVSLKLYLKDGYQLIHLLQVKGRRKRR